MFTIDAGTPEAQISIFVLFALGAMVGVLGGFFGVGGGWIITPALNILGMPMPFAIGTGLLYITGMSFVSALKHKTAGAIEPVLGIVLGLSMIAGIQAGKITVMALEKAGTADPVVRTLYIVLLFSLGIFMLYDFLARSNRPAKSSETGEERPVALFQRYRLKPMIHLSKNGINISFWPIAAAGIVTGFLAGILGAGGGFLLVPMLFYLAGVTTVTAVGTSLLCVLVASPFGTLAYALEGRVVFPAAAVMLAGVLVAAPLGVRAAHAVRGAQLRFLYAVMILCGGFSVVLKELDSRFDSRLLDISSKILIFAAGGAIVLSIMLMWLLAARRAARANPENSLD